MAQGSRVHGSNAEGEARRLAVRNLFAGATLPLTAEDVWLKTSPRMTKQQAAHAILRLREAGVIEKAEAANGYGRKVTYRFARGLVAST